MPSTDGTSDPFAAQRERLRQAVQAQREQQTADAKREQERLAGIREVLQDFPPPAALSPVERDEWISAVRDVAEKLSPADPGVAAGPSDTELAWMADDTGSTFLARRADHVAEIQQELADLIERQKKLADEHVWLRTPKSRTSRGDEHSDASVAKPELARSFTDEDLAQFSVADLEERVSEAWRLIRDLENDLQQLRLTGARGLGSMIRIPPAGGRQAPSHILRAELEAMEREDRNSVKRSSRTRSPELTGETDRPRRRRTRPAQVSGVADGSDAGVLGSADGREREITATTNGYELTVTNDAGVGVEVSPKDAEMMRLWKDERKTSPEIGHLLSFSPKTVRNRLSKLRKALGEELVPNRTRRRRARAL